METCKKHLKLPLEKHLKLPLEKHLKLPLEKHLKLPLEKHLKHMRNLKFAGFLFFLVQYLVLIPTVKIQHGV